MHADFALVYYIVVDIIALSLTIQFNHVMRMSFGVQRVGFVYQFHTNVTMFLTALMDMMNKTVHVRTSLVKSVCDNL